MTEKIYVIKTRNGKYASISYDEHFTFISENDTLISNAPFTTFESRQDAVRALINLNEDDDVIYCDDGIYLTDIVELNIKLEIEEV